jgi:hypothetical protein
VLDTRQFSSIIYIWYEDGELRPSLVRSLGEERVDLALPKLNRRGRCLGAKRAGIG